MATKPTLREVLDRASSFLEEQGVEGDSVLYVFLRRQGWTKTDWLLNMGRGATEEELAQVTADTAELARHVPAQYLLGSEEFCGHLFKVSPATLIPRPETEELVMRGVAAFDTRASQPIRVVDIGTGTGAIAISIKLAQPSWQVVATDISPEALTVAKENAAKLHAKVSFRLGDALEPFLADEPKIDLLLSNPPYISEEEWDLMDESVRRFEPKTALFAENHGLAIYQRLAAQAPAVLATDGQILLEIGFAQGKAVQRLFQEAFPEKQVTILQDMAGLDRIIHVY